MAHQQAIPIWQVKNTSGFASVCITLPPNASCHCESDAVVTMSESVGVQGELSGGIFGSLARAFLTRESFFTTKIQNSSNTNSGDVLIAPSDPGGVALHRLGAPGEQLLLTSGAYLGGDESVRVTSEARSPFSSLSHLSGSGMFLLRASGRGTLAISAYGSILQYTLRAGGKRSVDNGHIVAWSSGMKSSMKLASRGIFGSVTSGEGFHVEFEGPGVLFVQSHKPSTTTTSRDGSGYSSNQGFTVLVFFVMFVVFFFGFILLVYIGGNSGFLDMDNSGQGRTTYQSYNNYGQQHRQDLYDGDL